MVMAQPLYSNFIILNEWNGFKNESMNSIIIIIIRLLYAWQAKKNKNKLQNQIYSLGGYFIHGTNFCFFFWFYSISNQIKMKTVYSSDKLGEKTNENSFILHISEKKKLNQNVKWKKRLTTAEKNKHLFWNCELRSDSIRFENFSGNKDRKTNFEKQPELEKKYGEQHEMFLSNNDNFSK